MEGVEETFLISGMVAGMPIHLLMETEYEANAWIAFCANQYPHHDVRVFRIETYACLMPTRFELQ